jgi:2-oxoglutarate dehydrogenase E1 component
LQQAIQVIFLRTNNEQSPSRLTPLGLSRKISKSSSLTLTQRRSYVERKDEPQAFKRRRRAPAAARSGHNLRVERAKRKDMSVGIIFLEQLYPWPEQELQAALDQHPSAEEIVWVQEEPANMGAFTYVMPKLRRMGGNRGLRSVKRHARPPLQPALPRNTR